VQCAPARLYRVSLAEGDGGLPRARIGSCGWGPSPAKNIFCGQRNPIYGNAMELSVRAWETGSCFDSFQLGGDKCFANCPMRCSSGCHEAVSLYTFFSSTYLQFRQPPCASSVAQRRVSWPVVNLIRSSRLADRRLPEMLREEGVTGSTDYLPQNTGSLPRITAPRIGTLPKHVLRRNRSTNG